MKNRIKKHQGPPPPSHPVALSDALSASVQLNARVPAGMQIALKSALKLSGISMQTACQDSWKFYLGIEDPAAEARREAIKKAFETLYGDRRPFDALLAPLKSNAILTSRGGSAKITIPVRLGVSGSRMGS